MSDELFEVLRGSLRRAAAAAESIRLVVKAGAEPSRATNMRRLMPGVTLVFGTPMAELNRTASVLGTLARKDPLAVIGVCDALWRAGSLEERQVAGKVIGKIAIKHPQPCLVAIEAWLPTLDGWANCDNLACASMEPIMLAKPGDTLALCERWVADPNKWIRRFGVVVLRAFEKTSAPPSVFEILDRLRDEADRDVQKGVSWMMRDLSARHSQHVIAVLEAWAKRPDTGRRWMVKDGMKKLPAAAQQRLQALLGDIRQTGRS